MPSPQKRPLAEANVSSLKRKSLTFDMARIETRTRIPTPKPVPAAVSPLLDLLHINRLLDMNQNFVRKSKSQQVDCRRPDRSSNAEELFNRHLERQKNLEVELDSQLKDLRSKHEALQTDVVELRRTHKKILHRVSDLDTKIAAEKGRFEYSEDRIMKNVLHREQMMNLQVKDLINKLTSEYNEAKFQLQDQLAAAKNYNDEELLTEAQRLREETKELEEKYAKVVAENQRKLKEEALSLETELSKVLASKTSEASALEDQYQSKLAEFQSVEHEVKEMEASIQKLRDENSQLENEITRIKENARTFEADKVQLLKELLEAENNLAQAKAEASRWKAAVAEEGKSFGKAREQLNVHNTHRRMLEDAIMDYERGPRIYVRNSPKSSTQFAKEFSKDTCNQEMIDEFLCFVGTSVKRMLNCGIIISGHKQPGFVSQILSSSFDLILERTASAAFTGWSFEYVLRCVDVGQSPPVDLLDSRRPVSAEVRASLEDIRAQKMVIESSKDLKGIPIPEHSAGYLSILSIHGTFNGIVRQCDMLVLDISGADISRQHSLILGQDPSLKSLIDYCHSNRSLHLSQPDEQIITALEAIKQRYQK